MCHRRAQHCLKINFKFSVLKSNFKFNCRFVEQNTDDILNNQNNPEKQDKTKLKSQEEIEETVSTCKIFIFKQIL